jgi:hypothetical protein
MDVKVNGTGIVAELIPLNYNHYWERYSMGLIKKILKTTLLCNNAVRSIFCYRFLKKGFTLGWQTRIKEELFGE